MSIVKNGLLVHLHIKQWTGRRLDKQATDTVRTEHATASGVGQYTKKLLPGAQELADINRAVSSMRQWFYTQTLPWHSDGSRILSSANYFDFTAAYRVHRDEFTRCVQAFFTAYPTLCLHAQTSLGQLHRPGEYPTEMELQDCFQCDINFAPVPDIGDFRVELQEQERAAFLKQAKAAETAAVRDCWQRIYDVVSKAAATLHRPDAVFRDSLIANIEDTCALLPKLNVTDDPQLETMRREVAKLISTVQPDLVRNSAVERIDVATKLKDAEDRMRAFMGGA